MADTPKKILKRILDKQAVEVKQDYTGINDFLNIELSRGNNKIKLAVLNPIQINNSISF